MEELQARHRKELKELQGRITQKKKQASKKTRKAVNDECERLEEETKMRQAEELSSLKQGMSPQLDASQTELHDELNDLHVSKSNDVANDSTAAADTQRPRDGIEAQDLSSPVESTVHVKKPNRQKARLARRAAHQEDVIRQAKEEAEHLPDMKQQERNRMLDHMKSRKLQEKEIRADGHCLYSAVADQLDVLGVSLGKTSNDESNGPAYKSTREAAATYIEQHEDDFAGFLEEPLKDYVQKIRGTAEWGGQLELQALAKSYNVKINVLQDFGRVEEIEPDGKADDRQIWLGYYKHGFGLGEHYNSLRKIT